MARFDISARDQLNNPGKVFEEITKDAPNGLSTSRSKRGVQPISLTTFNLSEILMRIPAFSSTSSALELYQGLVTGALSSFWGEDDMMGLGNVLPPDVRQALVLANPDGMSSVGGSGGGDGGGDPDAPIDFSRPDSITPSKKAIPGSLSPATRYGARIAREVLGFNGTMGGRRHDPGSDHHTGHAIDLMTAPLGTVSTGAGKQMGDMIAAFFHHNRVQLRVKLIIWFDRIASPRDNWKWRYYERGRGQGPTWRHQDHPHLSFLDGPAPNNPKLSWPDGMRV